MGDIFACLSIQDCYFSGCNDSGEMRCEDLGSCWLDGCAGDPCGSLTHATGVCVGINDDYYCECQDSFVWNPESLDCEDSPCSDDPCASVENATGLCWAVGNDYVCACDVGFAWDPQTSLCELFDCQAEILTEAGVSGADGCSGSQVYDAKGLQDSSCTGYDTLSFERVYSLELPSQTTATVVMTPLGEFDAALWVTTDCGDLNGALCVVGGDLSTDGPESVVFTNDGAQARVYYVIADSYESCGLFDLALTLSP